MDIIPQWSFYCNDKTQSKNKQFLVQKPKIDVNKYHMTQETEKTTSNAKYTGVQHLNITATFSIIQRQH